jgi:hypothetical protein
MHDAAVTDALKVTDYLFEYDNDLAYMPKDLPTADPKPASWLSAFVKAQ